MRFDAEKERSFLSGVAAGYTDASPYSELKKDIIFDLMEPYLVSSKEKTGLQLGCAGGYETRKLADRLGSLSVVDGAQDFIKRVEESSCYSNVSFICSLFEELDSTRHRQRYDFIFCNYVLEHVFDVKLVLRQISGLLKADGKLFIVVPNFLALSRQIALKMGLIDDLQALTENDHRHGHRRVYCLETLTADVEEAGLVVLETQGVVLKILADFQLNKLLEEGFLLPRHIHALQKLAQSPENTRFSDSIFMVVSNPTSMDGIIAPNGLLF